MVANRLRVPEYTTDKYTEWALDFIRGKGPTQKSHGFFGFAMGQFMGPLLQLPGIWMTMPMQPPQNPDVYPPREGKPEYASNMEFWVEGTNGEAVEKGREGAVPVGMQDVPGRTLKDWVRQYQQGVWQSMKALGNCFWLWRRVASMRIL